MRSSVTVVIALVLTTLAFEVKLPFTQAARGGLSPAGWGMLSAADHPIVGRWTYRSGSFTDVHIYHADGRVTAPGNSEAHAKWYVEGGEVVSYWHNKWYNRFRLPVAGGRISGVAIDPSGARSNISLTRAE